MRRIDSPDRAVALFGAGKDGFKASVPGVAPATELTEKWFNHVQESLVRTIEAAGIALSEADYDQFVTALNTLDAAARDAAIAAAATDATAKANAAQVAAATDATTKTNAAQAAAIAAAATDATTKANAVIPSGSRMLFQQTAAPVGWTKDTTFNNAALRVVSGAAGSGGTVDFTTAFESRTPAGSIANTGSVGDTALTIAQMPSHTHSIETNTTGNGDTSTYPLGGSQYLSPGSATTNATGGGEAHTHAFSGTSTFTGTALDFAVKYTDVIIASKD
ncbi:MAG: hypothetical protein Q8Q81_00400 [Oxalobacteraceae bacterium]|nr:hypothetical protein [Oxalobacteraceae bacterium]